VTDNGQVTSYGPNLMNQYTTLNGATSLYDQNFNLYTLNGWRYDYDADKHLLLTTNGANTGQFVYDGLGRCVKRTINGVVTVITYDDWKPIMEWGGSGNLSAVNVYGPGADEILYRWVAATNSRYRYHHDIHGNVTFLVDWSGTQVVERYTYDAFGAPTIFSASNTQLPASAVGNRFLFQGREYLQELGIYDYRHRFYHPALGRFLQSDPTGFDAGDMNLSRYCGDDPVGRSDPLGLDWSYLPDQFPRNFDAINAIQNKGANGVTIRVKFEPVWEPISVKGGYQIKYHDVNIVSQSYIRTHQRHLVPGDSIWGPKREDPLSYRSKVRTLFHEWGQKGVDEKVYTARQRDGTFRRTIEDGKIYDSPKAAGAAVQKNAAKALEQFEERRNELGKALQQRDGMLQRSEFAQPLSAKDIDGTHQASGVPSLGVEAVNRYNGRL
jgi:RHS repeat-associated protein